MDRTTGYDFPQSDTDLILTKAETARLMRISTRSLERLDEDGRGPRRIDLTERRVGYWRADVLAWLKARTAPLKRAA